MINSITFTGAMWAYLYGLPPWFKGKDPIVSAYGHRQKYVAKEKHTIVGERSTYGYIRPPEDSDIYRNEEDYYVYIADGMRNGKPLASNDFNLTPFYPERLFVWGHDEKGAPVERAETLKHVAKIIPRMKNPEFWDPCLPYRGYQAMSFTFDEALRARPSFGISWYEALSVLKDLKDPAYEWDMMPGMNWTGTLYINHEKLKDE